MPIFEFKCLKCGDVFELLKMSSEDELEMKCPACGAEEFERVLSTSSYTMGFAKGESRGPEVRTRECSSGTCGTVELPGYSKS